MSGIATVVASSPSFSLPGNIAFGITAAFMIFSAVRVVTTKNIVHAALYLVLVLSGVAANYVLLQAEFVAVTQILVYIGAIVVLFLFGIMLTRAPLGHSEDLDNATQKPYAVLAGLAVLGVVAGSLIATFKDHRISFLSSNSVESISDSIFRDYLVPFEVASVMLLAALIGAIVLARKD